MSRAIVWIRLQAVAARAGVTLDELLTMTAADVARRLAL